MSDELSSPMLAGPIDLNDLHSACVTYDRYSKRKRELGDGELNAYNAALAHYRETAGVHVDDEETLRLIDLSDELQTRVLIDEFLNPWGCRVPKPPNPERKRIVDVICGWWEHVVRGGANELNLPHVSQRLGAPEANPSQYQDLYEQLASRMGKRTGGSSRRPAAASKILYILSPHFFPPWDEAIREALGTPTGTGKQYAAFLEKASSRARELVQDHSETALMEQIGQPDCTVVEAINKYCWTESRPAR